MYNNVYVSVTVRLSALSDYFVWTADVSRRTGHEDTSGRIQTEDAAVLWYEPEPPVYWDASWYTFY